MKVSCLLLFLFLFNSEITSADYFEGGQEVIPGAGVEFDTEEEQQKLTLEDGIPGPGGGKGKEWFQLPQTGHTGNIALQLFGLIILSGTIVVFYQISNRNASRDPFLV